MGCIKCMWTRTELVTLFLHGGHLLLQSVECILEILYFCLSVLNGLVNLYILVH